MQLLTCACVRLHACACAWGHACQHTQVFKDRVSLFSACEDSSLHMKHAKKLLYHFFNMKATVFDTHGMNIIILIYSSDRDQNNLIFLID
jgi:hypothetical protein